MSDDRSFVPRESVGLSLDHESIFSAVVLPIDDSIREPEVELGKEARVVGLSAESSRVGIATVLRICS